MKIIISTIKLILLIVIISVTIIAAASTTRVSCEGSMEKTNVSETNIEDKKKLKGNLTILFKNNKKYIKSERWIW